MPGLAARARSAVPSRPRRPRPPRPPCCATRTGPARPARYPGVFPSAMLKRYSRAVRLRRVRTSSGVCDPASHRTHVRRGTNRLEMITSQTYTHPYPRRARDGARAGADVRALRARLRRRPDDRLRSCSGCGDGVGAGDRRQLSDGARHSRRFECQPTPRWTWASRSPPPHVRSASASRVRQPRPVSSESSR